MPDAAKRRRFNGVSIARVLPAIFVGLIPFTLFDDALLKASYLLRGAIEPESSHKVILAQNTDEARRALALAADLRVKRCVLISTENLPGPCEFISIENRFSLESLEQGHKPENAQILFYGRLKSFSPIDAEIALKKHSQAMSGVEALVILDDSYKPRVPIPTPIGSLNQGEVALNIALDRIEGKGGELPSIWIQFLVSSLLALLTAAILYTYPTVLTLVFAIVLGGLEYVLAFMHFQDQGVLFPVTASWVSMLAVILLGMSDRLDRRERRDWDIEQEAENLKALDEMRHNFLSLVSHDLKTPIAKILSLLDRFTRGEFGEVTPPQRETLEKIVSTSGYLQRTISTLLLLSRIESRDFSIHRVPVDLNELLEAALVPHATAAAERGIRIEKEFEPMFLIDMDRDLMIQVINNLIDNALKYSPAHSLLKLRSGEAVNCPELSPPQPGIWFEVRDGGPGIPRQDRKRVLQKFIRGSNELTAADQSVKGTGLGLYLSKFFVEKHGGCIRLLSKTVDESLDPGDPAAQYFGDQESGTLVRVTLPIEAPLVDVS